MAACYSSAVSGLWRCSTTPYTVRESKPAHTVKTRPRPSAADSWTTISHQLAAKNQSGVIHTLIRRFARLTQPRPRADTRWHMRLSDARLCLDCEELHTDERCPLCASEAFVFVTRWIPTEQRPRRRRQVPEPPTRKSHRGRWLTGVGATGLAAFAVFRGWRWRSEPPRDDRAGDPE
jgi:hypothetical protein